MDNRNRDSLLDILIVAHLRPKMNGTLVACRTSHLSSPDAILTVSGKVAW